MGGRNMKHNKTISIPDDLFGAILIEAAKRRLSPKKYIETALPQLAYPTGISNETPDTESPIDRLLALEEELEGVRNVPANFDKRRDLQRQIDEIKKQLQ